MTKPVVTYRHAYYHNSVDLCDACVDTYNRAFPLGPVERGRHEGICALCDAREHVERSTQP